MLRILPLALLLCACTHHTVPKPVPAAAPVAQPVPGAQGYVWDCTQTSVRGMTQHRQTTVYNAAHEVPMVLRPGLANNFVDWSTQRLVVCANHQSSTGVKGQVDRILYVNGQTVIYASTHRGGGEDMLASQIVFAAVPRDGTAAIVQWTP